MRVEIVKKIGTSVITFDIEADKTEDALYRATNFTTIPEECGLCHSPKLLLDGNKANKDGKTYMYVKIKCLECGARSTMGKNIDGINVYWKEFEKYVPPDKK